MPLFKKRSPVEPLASTEAWTVFEGEHDGRPIIARFDSGLRTSAGHPDYGIQIGVAVPLTDPSPDGLPSPEENRQLQAIEDQIGELVAGRAVLAGVISTAGMREFVLYTGSQDWIEGFHHALEAKVASHEVQVMAQRDATWSVYRQFVE